jgi:hypothetical protein
MESHGVLDLIIFDQTYDMHYSSPIPFCGLQTQGDQYDVQYALAHTLLCFANIPTPRKVGFFSHMTVSHPSFAWLMHESVLQVVFPWNPHALKNTLLSFILYKNQVKKIAIFNITWFGKVYFHLHEQTLVLHTQQACLLSLIGLLHLHVH